MEDAAVKKVGAYLARLRKNADITQLELAEKLNLTRQTISKYECGTCLPDISTLVLLSKEFEVSVDSLIHAGETTLTVSILKKFVPCLSNESLESIFNEIIDGRLEDTLLYALLPYIRQMQLETQVENAVLEGALDEKVLDILQS